MAGPKRNRGSKNSSPNSGGPTTPKKKKFGDNDSAPSTPTSSPSSKRRRQSQPRLAGTKNDVSKPTWEDDSRPIILHGDKAHDDVWMAGYLELNTKYLVRNLALSPLVLPWAVEQNTFNWKPTEVPAAITALTESSDFGDGNTALGLKAFDKAQDVYDHYISPHQQDGGKVNPKLVPNEKRVEALVRILITVDEELECLTGELDQDQFREHYKDHRAQTEERIRMLNEMPYFGLPDIPLDRLQAPNLGPLEFNGRKEHASEKWVRILSLLRYANGRVSKSKYVMAGCIGSSLGESDAQRNKLTGEARRRLIDEAGTKWLGLEEDWDDQTIDPSGIPIWMRPEVMDIDKTRKIKGKDANKPERRAIKFEAVWLEDYPGETPDLGQRCRQAWADAGLREQFGIPAHVKHPDFAVRGKRPELRDPRNFLGYPQWRDSLRAGLFFTAWKLNFESAYLIDRKITKSAISPELLESGADELEAEGEQSAAAKEPRCVKIFDASGEDPPLDYSDFLTAVEKGQATQTLAFLCEPLEGPKIRHYPWETTLYISGSNEEPKFTDEDFSPAVEKDVEDKPEPEEEPEKQPSPVEAEPEQQPSAAEGEPEKQPTPVEEEPEQQPSPVEAEPEQQPSAAEGEPEKQPTPVEEEPEQQPSRVEEEPARRRNAPSRVKALVEQALRALPVSSASIKKVEALGKRIQADQDTSDTHLDIFDLEFDNEEAQLEFFHHFDVRTKYGRLGWTDHMIKTVLEDLRVSQRSTLWGNEKWLLETPNIEVTRKQIDEARNIADKERAAEADEEDNGIVQNFQEDHAGFEFEDDHEESEDQPPADVHSQSITQAAASMSVSSEACLGPPLQPCCVALGFVETPYKHGPNKLPTYKSPYFPTASGRHLLGHQVTGVTFLIYKLVGKIPKLPGFTKEQECAAEWLSRHIAQTWCAVLADNMGLGKTFETISAIYFVMSNAPHFVEKGEKYKPTLILPPSTEILRIWDKELAEHYPRIQRVIAAHVNKESLAPGSKYVTRAQCAGLENWPQGLRFVWDGKDRNSEWTVILSTMETYASRTLRVERREEKKVIWRSRWSEKGCKFRTLVLDEAQKIRNTWTKAYQAACYTEYERSVLISATPSFMNHKDVVALYNITWGSYQAYMELHHPDKLAWCEKNVKSPKTMHKLDDMAVDDPRKAFAIKPKLVNALISNGQLPVLNRYMPLVEGCVMVRRSTQSFIPDGIDGGLVSLRGLLPEVKALTAYIQQDPFGESFSQAVHYNLALDFNEAIQNFMKKGGMARAAVDARVRPNLTENTRRFLLVSAGTNLYRLNDIFRKADDRANLSVSAMKDGKMDLHTPTLTKMRHAGVDAFDLADILRVDSDPEWDIESGKAKDALWILVRGCPVLQFILQQVREKIVAPLKTGRPIKKIEIVEEVPATAFYYERVLQFVGIKARVYHSALNPTEREKLKAEFRSVDEDSVAVLILMYRVGSVGLNLDGGCSTVIIATPGDSHYKEEQAAYRVIRITTKHGVVEIIRIKVQNSYHEYKESRQIDRLIPDLASREFDPKNLAAMLNALQVEIDEAHESGAGKDLIQREDLLVESYSRERMRNVLLQLKKTLNPEAEDSGTKPRDPSREEILSSYRLISSDARGFSGEFLEKMSRKAYYKQWRPLEAKTKSLFSHSKNRLRRLLTFPAGKIYTAVDLEVAAHSGDEAIMERAFECLYKIKVGTRNVHHKPGPHIDFDMLPEGTDWAVFENMPDIELPDGFDDDDEMVEENGRVDENDKPDSEVDSSDEEEATEVQIFTG